MRVPVGLSQSEIRATLGVEILSGKSWFLGVQYRKSVSEHFDIDHWSFDLTISF